MAFKRAGDGLRPSPPPKTEKYCNTVNDIRTPLTHKFCLSEKWPMAVKIGKVYTLKNITNRIGGYRWKTYMMF